MIGILDWGIGGLGLYRLLRERHPRTPVIYLSDSGAIPYGKQPAAVLAARVRAVSTMLGGLGVNRLVVACNAASTVLPRLGVAGVAGTIETGHGPIEVTGVIAHAVRMTQELDVRSIGVIGGSRTIRSGVYRRALADRKRIVRQRIAQPLSARIEGGDLDSPELRLELGRILRPLRDVDALLLACTHYPAIRPLIAERVPGVVVLDPAREVLAWIEGHWDLRSHRGVEDRFLTSGDARAMRRAGRLAFGVELPRVERCSVAGGVRLRHAGSR